MMGKNRIQLAARELGALGGLKGGPARAAVLSSEERQQIASHAAKTRWKRESVYTPTLQTEGDWAIKARGALDLIAYHDSFAPDHELRKWLEDVILIHSGRVRG
jgi:hypothetical protein